MIEGFARADLIDKQTQRASNASCLAPSPGIDPEAFRAIRLIPG
jgi:DNA-binding transcriptional regulator YiaG